MGQENRENLELKCFSSVISMSTFKCTAKLFFKNFNENLQANLAFYQERMLFIYKPSEDVLTHWRFFSEHFFHIGRPSDKTLSHRSFCFTDCHFPTQAKKYPENSQSDLLLPDWLSTDASTSQLNFSNYCMYLNMFHFLGNLCCNMGYTSFL